MRTLVAKTSRVFRFKVTNRDNTVTEYEFGATPVDVTDDVAAAVLNLVGGSLILDKGPVGEPDEPEGTEALPLDEEAPAPAVYRCSKCGHDHVEGSKVYAEHTEFAVAGA